MIFDELASEEFNDAVEYYEYQVKGLGKRYKEEISHALKRIKRFSEIGLELVFECVDCVDAALTQSMHSKQKLNEYQPKT